MKNIFKKKDEKLNQDIQMEMKFQNMETELKRLVFEKTNELNTTIQKLQRIIKYSKDTPYFRILNMKHFYSLYITITFDLYLYIDKEEYIISLKELENISVDYKDCTLKVENNIAYFNIVLPTSESSRTYKFIIDYKKGTYVLVKR